MSPNDSTVSQQIFDWKPQALNPYIIIIKDYI